MVEQKKKEDSERKYKTFNYPTSVSGGKTLLTGIRGVAKECRQTEKVYMTGFYEPAPNQPDQNVKSFVYKGFLTGKNGTWNLLNYPGATITNLYGPDNYEKEISVVGNYTYEGVNSTFGCLYQGPLDGTGRWTPLLPPFGDVKNVIAHSNMCGVAVGNYDTTVIQGKAFIYDINENIYYNILKKGAISITAYGIWYNGNDSYTICGGYKTKLVTDSTEAGYLVDWDNYNKKFHNWRTYHYNNDPTTKITHFDGITGNYKGDGYNLTGDWVGSSNTPGGFFASVRNNKYNKHNKCNKAKWSSLSYPNSDFTSGNSVYQKSVIGVYTEVENQTVNGFVSRV